MASPTTSSPPEPATAAPIDTVPLVSQAKSLFQAITGDLKGASQTQDNFSRGCPVVSQVRAVVEDTIIQDPAAAARTRSHFSSFSMDHCLFLSQAKSLVQVLKGDARGALQTQENFSRGCAVVSQARSLVESTILRDPAAALKTQEYFLGKQGETKPAPSSTVAADDDDDDSAWTTTRDPNLECVVCLSATKNVLLLPCKHLCLCTSCSAHITTECPLCKTKIEAKTTVFI
ncbi:hypothetical protein SPRG_20520 [Saprolegnia parasitica CBS 223.65]|uniref:RING-type domain-containing protein n=1 Tax=Saprolegnia parasitica (strain CBS 223.65) TaxID=695850 RepID=A0A067CIW9_SAPPC|nr:hypothetical protein SPRG_20520 [Saprolegnia parasitica CBS 223.65]KDO26722.1 hypothetical protein SPRG_20520 [Saprolegnia parasitica CBS 223.65]|eukprot:XP_012202606.1 hypothetical protein SPRG_20520 [Saprolegnia parasitica CBS 223.65]